MLMDYDQTCYRSCRRCLCAEWYCIMLIHSHVTVSFDCICNHCSFSVCYADTSILCRVFSAKVEPAQRTQCIYGRMLQLGCQSTVCSYTRLKWTACWVAPLAVLALPQWHLLRLHWHKPESGMFHWYWYIAICVRMYVHMYIYTC